MDIDLLVNFELKEFKLDFNFFRLTTVQNYYSRTLSSFKYSMAIISSYIYFNLLFIGLFNSVILIFTDKIIKSFIVFELELLITWVRINIFNRNLRKDIKKIRKEENSIFKHSLLGY